MNQLISLIKQTPVLYYTGMANLALALVLALLWSYDTSSPELLGINRWIKPFKFTVAAGVYLLTMSAIVPAMASGIPARLIAWVVALTMVLEIVCIVGQAARGQLSHFNNSSAFDAAVFGAMALGVVFNTLAVMLLLVLSFTKGGQASEPMLKGLQWALVIFIAGQGQVILDRIQSFRV